MKKKNNTNQFGFTLAEVMVAAGLIGVLSMAVVNMIGNINRTSKRASQVFNIQQEIQRISGILADEDSCFKTFNGRSFGSTANGSSLTFNEIRRSTGPNPGDFDTIYTLDQELGGTDGIVHIEAMSATTTSNPGPVYLENGVNATKVDASVRVTFQKGRAGADIDIVKKSSVGMTDVSRDFPLSFVINAATGAVLSCYGSASQYTDAVCDALGGEIDSNGECVQVTLKSRSAGTPEAQVPLDYSAQVGSATAAQISPNNIANAPLKIHNGGASSILIDDDTIQAANSVSTDPSTMTFPTLNINPYGTTTIGGPDGSGDVHSSLTEYPPLKIKRESRAFLSLDDNSLQAAYKNAAPSNAVVSRDLNLNPRGSNVLVGRTGGTTNLKIYGNVIMGDDSGATATRVLEMYDGSYINFRSDENLKHNIHELEKVLEKFSEIRGVEFVWNSNNRRDIGYIAQEIEKVFPEIVSTDAKGLKSVQYTKMPAVNTAAIKELKRENDELKFRVNLLMKALCNGEDAYKYEEVCSIPVAPLE
ncbi:prepilin-type cleavage/methylation N-terminal domain protein [Bacteriovorax sp. BAL6_X]|uniref:tail fiber domain-containing protein n=1 Tax=Bacteriovorax sp. BAL6_X TaxID=1201290 RepID=UPI000385A0F4|nr:tail fiber domain-containing protein [Bacteriovorax sp. BAL6_X]EPZ52182.1 prepilin-type cleavage/methylation N-terminal domain protein [Bacteriovorax sp. BAL6_X]